MKAKWESETERLRKCLKIGTRFRNRLCDLINRKGVASMTGSRLVPGHEKDPSSEDGSPNIADDYRILRGKAHDFNRGMKAPSLLNMVVCR